MRRLLTILTGRHSVVTLAVTLLLLQLVLIAAAFLPDVRAFLLGTNLFQIVVVTALLEILLLLSARVLQETPTAISQDEAAKQLIRQLIREDKSVRWVKVLSAGMGSRAPFLRSLLEDPADLKVEVVTCYSEANPDLLDRETIGPGQFEVLTNRLSEEQKRRLRVHQSHNTPSLRCILLAGESAPRYAFLSWYLYENQNRHISGRRNLQIFVDSTTLVGKELLSFAARAFERYAGPPESEQIWPPD